MYMLICRANATIISYIICQKYLVHNFSRFPQPHIIAVLENVESRTNKTGYVDTFHFVVSSKTISAKIASRTGEGLP